MKIYNLIFVIELNFSYNKARCTAVDSNKNRCTATITVVLITGSYEL